MNKKADLSINVVIVAILALLVLVVLSLIFMGRLKIFATQTGDCLQNGGSCIRADTVSTSCSGDFQKVQSNLACYENGKVSKDYSCCISVTS